MEHTKIADATAITSITTSFETVVLLLEEQSADTVQARQGKEISDPELSVPVPISVKLSISTLILNPRHNTLFR